MEGDYIAFGSLILNGEGALGQTGALYTVERATGLASLPTPRVTITQLAGVPGAVLSEAQDDVRVVTLEGEIHAPSHALLEEELPRFKYYLSQQRGAQWLYWTPEGQTARKIEAVLQNDGAVMLDAEDDASAVFQLEFICADPYWRALTSTTTSTSITGSGDTLSVTNLGDAWSEPVIRITPTSGKATEYLYKRWLAIYNRVTTRALTNYPLEVTTQTGAGFAHDALVGAGKAQADGDDLRVEVDGVEVDRWLNGPNTANCKVWVNLTYQAGRGAVLGETFAAGATVSSITVDDTSGFPTTGILYNPTSAEAFVYTGKDDVLNRFTGVTRAAKGTTAADNTSGQTLWWVEHDVWLLYGNAAATAPTVDDNYKPSFELDHSTNTSWVYEVFGEDDGLRTAPWGYWCLVTDEQYTATEGGTADPWEVLGYMGRIGSPEHRLHLYNPCGITNANFTNGKEYATDVSRWTTVEIQSSTDGSAWTTEYSIPAPSVDSSWEAWSRDEALTSGALYVCLYMYYLYNSACLEAGDCTLTIDSTYTPAIVLGDEQGDYDLDVTLTMVEDGSDVAAMQLQFTMDVDQTLEIDCDDRTVTYLKDDSNQFQALTLQSVSLRNYWFRLPGYWDGGKAITFRYDETGVIGTTLAVIHYHRWL